MEIEGKQRTGTSWKNVVFGLLLAVSAFGIFSGGKFAYETVIATAPQEKSTGLFFEQYVLVTGAPVVSSTPERIVITPPPLPELTGKLPSSETFSAESIFAKDHDTGVVLYAKQGYSPHAMASISKLMSALVL